MAAGLGLRLGVKEVLLVLLGATLQWSFGQWARQRLATNRTADRAWMLIVKLTFTSEASLQTFLRDFAPMAAAVRDHEAGTLSYEACQSDKDPLSITLVERYRTKADYLDYHKSTRHFLKFRPRLQKLQDSGEVVVTGESVTELGLGYM